MPTYRGEVTWTEDQLQALMSAIAYLRAHGRDCTAEDLAALLKSLGGPDMSQPTSLRHQGPA